MAPLHGARRVDDWRGGGRTWGVAVAGSFRQCRCLSPCHDSVSSRRSANPTCGFPALGSRTRSCLRPRKAGRSRTEASELVVFPQLHVRESHVLPGPHLVLAAQPSTQPPGGVPVHRRVSRTDLTQAEVVRPTSHQPIQAPYHHFRFQKSVARCGHLAHPAADALNACLARARADIGAARVPAIVTSNPVAKELDGAPPAPGSIGSSRH